MSTVKVSHGTTATRTPPPPLPFHLQFVAGAAAGIFEVLMMYPLDVVKTRFQLQVGSNVYYTSVFDCLKKIVATEGPSRLYRGILAPLMVESPKRAAKFASNEQYSRLFMNISGKAKMDQQLSILTGIASGLTEAFIIVSFDLVKIRMQDKSSAYKNTLDCMARIMREEGPATFFKGLEATLWRHGAWNGGYFGVIFGVKEALQKHRPLDGKAGTAGVLVNNFIAGVIGGTVGTVLNTPFDVVKTRIQAVQQLTSTGAGAGTVANMKPKYNWALPALHTVFKEEGFRALYKGFTPKVLRLGPGGGVLLVAYDFVSSKLRQFV